MATSLELVEDQIAKDDTVLPVLNLDTLSDDLLSGKVDAADFARQFSNPDFVKASQLANPPAEVITTTSDAAIDFVVELAPDVVNDPVAFQTFLTANELSSTDAVLTSSKTDSTLASADFAAAPIALNLVHIINGTIDDDILIGKATNDYIFGLAGRDLLFGEDGDDFLFGGDGSDILLGGIGDDNLFGERGNDILFNDAGNDNLIGGAGNDYFYVLDPSGSSLLNGENGIDTADYSILSQAITLKSTGTVTKGIGFGTDQLVQVEKIFATSSLNDWIDASDAISPTSVTVDLSALSSSLVINNVPGLGTLTFSVSGFENVRGTAQDDSITGDNFNNILSGGAGNDVFGGSRGNDTINGDAGIDTANYSALGQTIVLGSTGTITKAGGFGIDQLNEEIETITASTLLGDTIDFSTATGSTSITANLGANSLTVNNFPGLGTVNLTVNNFENVTGTAQDDSITGNIGNNILSGGAGNDVFGGSRGNDIINGDAGIDTVDYSALGQTIVLGSTGTITKAGGFGIDQLNEEIETITASTLLGDTIDFSTATGSTSITANLGANSLTVNNFPGLGTVNLTVNNFENVTGTAQNDIITGNTANNILSGGAGNDFLTGGAGRDTLIGGSGVDILAGGAGNDQFNFSNPAEGSDIITDFAFIPDTIAVSASGFAGGLTLGILSSLQFFTGTSATTADQRFIYNNLTGGLFFDVDGNGTATQQQIASLTPLPLPPILTSSNILVIA
ncbi:beta strand repeat-containing protein [Nostoc sp. WHI]|uniref:beta strand repeat-containing protein n=1 Tax=Nostoc sp. WHI TaxID=2650611 RepID=UPI0018C46D1C|nr:hypothetical protein [Nostoc sp. WHI]MBG1266829.1 hypothetical protein [Nostoc sp. WHI]